MDRECLIWLKNKSKLREADQQFGLWMKAATPNLAQRMVVRVAGFEDEGGKNTNYTEAWDDQGREERVPSPMSVIRIEV